MDKNLDGLSAKQLQDLIKDAESRLSEARIQEVQKTRAHIDDILSKSGLSLSEVYPETMGKVKVRAKRAGAGVPKYRHPTDPTKTWSGQGKKPNWFVEAIGKRGVTAESLLISAASAPNAPRKVATAKKVAKKRVVRKAAK
ncbi:H-NS histone family protein [Burkholderia sp. Bp9012]|uniref:H-NS histone family protein n=1 Tax=Burkholderia sp. Bp9012 TaxID=2184562 RepID=UPI000F5A447F|nr:H-NS histone family protein [Burkholderia sp. Bp9012]RQR79147.1 H-NS histone family protein [Burkholderia sp. Bp9012]